MAQTPNFTYREKISRDWAKVQANPFCWKKTGTKYIIPMQQFSKLLYWSQRYQPKTNFLSMVLDGSENLFYRKRWGKRSRLVLYRCRVAQSGGNWLKLAKTKCLVDKLLCNIDPLLALKKVKIEYYYDTVLANFSQFAPLCATLHLYRTILDLLPLLFFLYNFLVVPCGPFENFLFWLYFWGPCMNLIFSCEGQIHFFYIFAIYFDFFVSLSKV